jgi:predicted dehydrogenase
VEVEDTVVACFEFANGGVGNLEAATSAYPGFARRIEMSWSQGTVILEDNRIREATLMTPIDDLTAGSSLPGDQRAASPEMSDTTGHRRVIEDFIQAVASGGEPLCTGRDARRSVELVSSIYESSRTGRPVLMNNRRLRAENP